jgi:hypothetical protein
MADTNTLPQTTPHTIYLLSLKTTVEQDQLSTLINRICKEFKNSSPKPLVIGKPQGWVVKPHHPTLGPPLTSHDWHLCIFLPGIEPGLPSSIMDHVATTWSLTTDIHNPYLDELSQNHKSLLHLSPEDATPLTGSLDGPRVNDPELEVPYTPELHEFFESVAARVPEGTRPVSMLNLMKYTPGGRNNFLNYVRVFTEERVGTKRGAIPELFGEMHMKGETEESKANNAWEDTALVYYPSIWHFADLVASEEYRECDKKYKIGAVEDTGILAVSEMDLDDI